ncbi:MAG: ArsB/NhaD family transporter [Candidatus Theseobacter exili]|nr:ArsB/NhaD family transporter [Candidatus Theseobacter exili]
MTLSIIIFLITYMMIASEKVDKTVAALLGAGAVIMLHLAPYDKLLSAVDLNVIFLLVGMMIIVHIMSLTGVFEWIAIMIAQKAKGNGIVILVELLVVTAILSAFLDNVTTVIFIAPITILITQILEIPTVPILIMEAIFSNIGGTSTLVGDPPNILIGSRVGLTFNEFLINQGPVVLIISGVSLLIVIPLLGKVLKVSPEAKSRIMKAKPERAIIEPGILYRAIPVFLLVLAGFFLSRVLRIEPGIIALTGAVLMALVCKVDLSHAMEKVSWSTILFFIGLFMLIGALEFNGLFTILGRAVIFWTHGNFLLTVIAVLWFCAVFSALVDNIPLVIAMIPIIKTLIPVFAVQFGIQDMPELVRVQITEPLFWALSLGACLGGNGSLVGASANVVISQIAKRNKYKLSFWDFSKYGFPLMIVSLVISSLYLYIRYFLIR